MRQEDSRPFARELLIRRAAPFVVAMVVAFAVLPLGDDPVGVGWLAGALGLAFVLAAVTWFVPWPDLPDWAQAIPPLACFGVVAMLRESQDGALTGYGPLVLLPVLWLLLYGTRAQITVAVGCVAVTLSLPILAEGGAGAAVDARLALVWTVTAGVVCFTVMKLVGEIRRQADELERLASTDTLTGLPNRRVWEDALPRELARSTRAGTPVSIAIIDLDHFKAYNDTLGHQAGDLLLKEIAALWPAELRDSDLLARFGGEEFALLLPDCGTADIGPVVEKVRVAVPAGASASAGAAVWDGLEEPSELIRRADEALYAAKREGRDRTVVAGRGAQPEPAGA